MWGRGRQAWSKPVGEEELAMQSIIHTNIHLHLSFLDNGIDPFFSLFPFEQFSSLLSLLTTMINIATVQLMPTTRSLLSVLPSAVFS